MRTVFWFFLLITIAGVVVYSAIGINAPVMWRWIFEQSLTLFFTVLFFGSLFGQSIAGHRAHNEEQLAHDADTIGYGRYLVSTSVRR